MTVSKIEAAERQLDAAIRLFFAAEDWIAVHTLAAASGRILRDLAEQRGSSVWNTLNAHIKPEKRKYVWAELNKVANFFKHADRDPDELLDEVDPMENDHLVSINILLFSDLEGRGTRPVSAFLSWYTGAYPDVLRDQGIPILATFKHLAVSIQHDLSRAEQVAFWQTILKQNPQAERER